MISDLPVTHMSYGADAEPRNLIRTLVTLSSGDTFYVDAPPSKVAERVAAAESPGLMMIGSRWINPAQIAQLTPAREVPSIHTPERLED